MVEEEEERRDQPSSVYPFSPMPPKRKRNSAAAEADADSPAPARKKKATRTSSANTDTDSALDLLARARAAIQQSKERSPKLQQLVAALRALAAQDAGPTVRLPRAAQADSDAVRLLRDAVLALRQAGGDVSDGVRAAVAEIQQLVEPQALEEMPTTNGTPKPTAKTKATKTKTPAKPALASVSASSTAVSVVPPATKAKAAKVVVEEGTPPPEYTLDDDQDMPNNALDPDADYGWDSDEFTLLDHLTSFIDDDDGGSSAGSSDFAADYGPGEDDPWSGDEEDEYYSD